MNLQEQIGRMLKMMGIISETKMDNFFYDHFDKVFDKVTFVGDEDLNNHKWVDLGDHYPKHRNDSSYRDVVLSRNHWGRLWFNNCEFLKELKFPQKMLRASDEVFKEKLLDYLNIKYGYYKIQRPVKDVGDELYCDEEWD